MTSFSGPVPLIEGKLGVIGLLPFNIDGEDFDVSGSDHVLRNITKSIANSIVLR